MNRVIKFRFWDGAHMRTDFDGWDESVGINAMFEYLKENSITAMEFTGLIDKNGKEIYEGDIITTATGINCEVVLYDGGFKYQVTSNTRRPIFKTVAFQSQVIGNKFENPELITPNQPFLPV